MDITRERMTLVKHVPGRESQRGWIIINLRGLEMETINEIRLDLDQVELLEGQQEDSARLFDSLASRLPDDEDAGGQ
jgi:hypothetical protein